MSTILNDEEPGPTPGDEQAVWDAYHGNSIADPLRHKPQFDGAKWYDREIMRALRRVMAYYQART